ncbi:hypothetical protein [Sulfurospirillum sp. hDNRA2]|uniref:hypothetical protein n=1 Tax=Sulfurospirillum sp. hDNRA2 TaxID=3237298 RepID=UPI0020B66BB4|nr:hypothetical protein [Sulfurospirillum sp. DNRA8]MCP3652925.1 hypothetical protein [Sulfurospirillum sp. DNRA8]MCR1811777.1 hypothetical protein [Sulfurospirillum sp. DNRA8]
MKYIAHDLETVVLNSFYNYNEPTHRYASFDYCFNFFQNTTYVELENDIEKACLQLSFYLASWGMLRGSSFLLQKSAKHYEPLIKYLINLKKEDNDIWNIDVDCYTKRNIKTILTIYEGITTNILDKDSTNQTLTLNTKIMLGVFGCIPAFDQYFTETFRQIFKHECGFRSVSEKALLALKKFYEENSDSVNSLQDKITTLDFATSSKGSLNYTKAKIIDMYGFAKRNQLSLMTSEI